MRSFVYSGHAARVVFGVGTIAQLRAEVERLSCARVLVLASPELAAPAKRARDVLGPLGVGEFDGVAMHTPVEVTERALELVRAHGVDCLVSIGGGSTTGLGKALALRTGLPQIAVPTTYAGSEVTPVVGETEHGLKTTRSSPAIVPKSVIYDVELTVDLPVHLTVTSGINALAHAVEAMYSAEANPVTDAMAVESISGLARALPAIVADPSQLDSRADALLAAWLAGTCLGTVGMGLHHKLCHTLGGSFGLPHSETHTVVLPHVMAYNAPATTGVMRRIADALHVRDAPTGIYDLISSLGGPTSLRGLGMAEAELSRAAELATATPYPNPREITTAGVAEVLRGAWQGARPAPSTAGGDDRLSRLTDQVVASFAQAPDPRTRQLLTDLVSHLHHFAASNDLTEAEWSHAIGFLTRTGQLSSDTRQEFVLLSDTLGVSSMVDLLTNSRSPETTPSAVLGPFYVDGPPAADHGADIAQGLPGTPLWCDVRITDLDGCAVPDAVVDVWQSNKDGFYDVQLPDLEGPVLRARFRTDASGELRFWSILPSQYPIPQDGPVGELLKAAARHPFRAPHLHFMINAPGHRRLITQLFVAGGSYLDSDTVFGVKDELIVEFAQRHGPTPDGRAVEGEWRSLDFTFRIAPDRAEQPNDAVEESR
jgi:maleylacetate reductase